MKYLIHITTAITFLLSTIAGATIKTIDTDYYGKTIYIESDTKEVITVGTGWTGDKEVDGTTEQGQPYALGINDAVSVNASVGRQFILRADGTVWMVARQTDNNDIKISPPIIQLPISNVSDVEANADYAFFIVEGSVYQMNVTKQHDALLVEGLPNNVVEISAAIFHSVARTANGEVYIWGGNSNDQLADGSNLDREKPRIIAGLPAIKAISTERHNTILTDINGNEWAMDEGEKCHQQWCYLITPRSK